MTPKQKTEELKCEGSYLYSKDNNKNLRFHCRFCDKEMTYREDRICEARKQIKSFIRTLISEAEKRGYRTGVFEEAVRLKEAREETIRECLEIINRSIDKTDAYSEIKKLK